MTLMKQLDKFKRVVISDDMLDDIDKLLSLTEKTSNRHEYLKQARTMIKMYNREVKKD